MIESVIAPTLVKDFLTFQSSLDLVSGVTAFTELQQATQCLTGLTQLESLKRTEIDGKAESILEIRLGMEKGV